MLPLCLDCEQRAIRGQHLHLLAKAQRQLRGRSRSGFYLMPMAHALLAPEMPGCMKKVGIGATRFRCSGGVSGPLFNSPVGPSLTIRRQFPGMTQPVRNHSPAMTIASRPQILLMLIKTPHAPYWTY